MLSASANKLSRLKERAEEYASLIMEELDPENFGYIEVRNGHSCSLLFFFLLIISCLLFLLLGKFLKSHPFNYWDFYPHSCPLHTTFLYMPFPPNILST